MTEATPSQRENVITIDDEIKNHLDRVVRGNVEHPSGGRGGPAVQRAGLRAHAGASRHACRNSKLKKIVADLSLDSRFISEGIRPPYFVRQL
jgi:hypothetical protein